jgi:hypothetical protein
MYERTVSITEQDVQFVKLALEHYRLFAKTVERQADTRDVQRTLGVFRAQEFYAERFLKRISTDG